MNETVRLFDFLYKQLQNYPKSDMLCGKVNGKWLSYSTSEVVDYVNRLSAGLSKLGLSGNDMLIENQDKIAIISRSRPEWLMLDMACQQIGVALCPIYPTTNISEIEFIFNDVEVKYVFFSDEDILEKIIAVKEKVPSLIGYYSFDNIPEIPFWKNVLVEKNDPEIEKVNNFKDKVKATDCATIIYTSGTAGTPKGVMLSHRNIASNVLNSTSSFPFSINPQSRSLSFLPLNHIFERMVSYIYINCGTSIYYAQSLETIGDDLKDVKPNIFTTVPRLLEKVYEKIMLKGSELSGIKRKLFDWAVDLANDFEGTGKGNFWYKFQLSIANKLIFTKWREALGNEVDFIISGGAACQTKLIKIFTAAKIPIYEGYGPTENSPVITVNCRKNNGTKFGTVGVVIDQQEVRLEPDGEICVKGPSVMMGYYKRPDLTNEAIKDGWLYTGDIGVWEDGRFLKITDRKKELFKTSGGKYVAPQVIENKIKESSLVEQIMVVGADEKFVAALIVPSFANLKNWCQKNGINYTSNEDVIKLPEVNTMYKNLIENYNSTFNHVEQVKKFQLLPAEWSIDTGEMTPKLSLKRKVIMEKFKQAIEQIYSK